MRSLKRFAVALLLAWALPVQLWAGTIGTEFQINSFTSNFQRDSAVAADGAGNFVVVWEGDYGQDGDSLGVFGQRFDSAGAALGTEFQANTYTTERQQNAAVAADSAGNFVVVWESRSQTGDSNYGIFGQRFSSAGSALGTEFHANTYTTTAQFDPAVASDGAGNFVVVWTGYQDYASSKGVFGQRFDNTGTALGTEFQINSTTIASQDRAAVATDSAGNFVVVWQSLFQDGDSRGIIGQRYDNTGAALGTEFQVNSFTTGSQNYPGVAVDGAGNIVVVWTIYGDSVEGQRFDNTGAALDTEFEVSDGSNFDSYAGVAADSAGNFMVTWQSGDPSGHGVFARQFDSTGTAAGSEFQVNTYTTDHQSYPAVAAGSTGDFLVAWDSDDEDGSDEGIFGQRLCTETACTNGDGCCPVGCDMSTDDDCPPPPTTTTTTLPSACASMPEMGCLDGEGASFQIKDSDDDTKDQIKWKLKKGDGFAQNVLGNPATTRAYSLCIYDETGGVPALVGTITIDPNANWEDKSPKGFSYKDKTGTEDGVTKASLKPGATTKSSVSVSAKGTAIPMPLHYSLTEIFNVDTAVTVQLVNDETSLCWTSEFTTVKANTAEQFKASAP